ncbi:MAG: hypothetical protein IJ188_02905 [Clostridia bacterium]|nr:hypothetical protein [Clostridia bacterium]
MTLSLREGAAMRRSLSGKKTAFPEQILPHINKKKQVFKGKYYFFLILMTKAKKTEGKRKKNKGEGM